MSSSSSGREDDDKNRQQIASRNGQIEREKGGERGVGATPNGIIFTNLALINF